MPLANSAQIVTAIINAFQDSGGSGILVSESEERPRRFVVQTPAGSISVWIYIWNLTGGGRKEYPHERRIQKTGVPASPMDSNPLGCTLILGYEPNLKVFAGFDFNRHRFFTPGSPSAFIDIRCLEHALSDGMYFDQNENDEIAVGFRSDQMLDYISNAAELHQLGTAHEVFDLLSKATKSEPIPAAKLAALTPERQRVVSTISQLSRVRSFSQKVRVAYESRCAVTRMQLRLCEAAHILPVLAPGSVDEVRNGLFLSATYHRAFDTGLIYLDEKLVMRLNPKRAAELTATKLDGGLPDFRGTVGRSIHLTPDAAQRPDPALIRQANIFRRIAV